MYYNRKEPPGQLKKKGPEGPKEQVYLINAAIDLSLRVGVSQLRPIPCGSALRREIVKWRGGWAIPLVGLSVVLRLKA
jgi:hypothetical protein